MSETPNSQFHRSDSAFLTILTTEHYNLQSARFATISDSNGRASLFLGSVSSSLVALAFIGQAAQFGEAFRVFGLVLFPMLGVLGLFTFKRVLQSAVDDIVYDFGINLIRHFYAEMAPDAAPYLVLSTHDDGTGMMRAMGARSGFGQLFLTTAGMISVITSALVGVFVSLLLDTLVTHSLTVVTACGLVVFALSVAMHLMYQHEAFRRMSSDNPPRFPSPRSGDSAGDITTPTTH